MYIENAMWYLSSGGTYLLRLEMSELKKIEKAMWYLSFGGTYPPSFTVCD